MSKKYYEAPSEEVFSEIKAACIALWITLDAKEEIDRIIGLENISDNAMTMIAMFDEVNQYKLRMVLSSEAKEAIRERISGFESSSPFLEKITPETSDDFDGLMMRIEDMVRASKKSPEQKHTVVLMASNSDGKDGKMAVSSSFPAVVIIEKIISDLLFGVGHGTEQNLFKIAMKELEEHGSCDDPNCEVKVIKSMLEKMKETYEAFALFRGVRH